MCCAFVPAADGVHCEPIRHGLLTMAAWRAPVLGTEQVWTCKFCGSLLTVPPHCCLKDRQPGPGRNRPSGDVLAGQWAVESAAGTPKRLLRDGEVLFLPLLVLFPFLGVPCWHGGRGQISWWKFKVAHDALGPRVICCTATAAAVHRPLAVFGAPLDRGTLVAWHVITAELLLVAPVWAARAVERPAQIVLEVGCPDWSVGVNAPVLPVNGR